MPEYDTKIANCLLLEEILRLQKLREPYVRKFINKTLRDEAEKIDVEMEI